LLLAFVFSFLLGCLFHILTLDVLIGLHVRVKNHPLGCLNREGARLWWISLDTLFSKWKIEGLGRSLLVEELVTKWLFLSSFVFVVYNRKFKY